MDFTGLSFALLVWEFWFGIGWRYVSFGWVGCVRYFGIESTRVPADSKLLENSLFARFFTAGSRLVLLEVRQCAD